MNLRQLRILQAVRARMNITRAAEDLYISQSAVSQAVAELERELGFALFDRLSGRIALTEAGRAFADRAAQLVAQFDELEQSAKEMANRAPLRVGASITLASYLLPGAARAFQARHPGARVEARVDNARAVEALVLAGAVDLALLEGVVRGESLIALALPASRLALVCAPGHLCAGREISLEEFLAQNLLLREVGSAIRDTLDSALLLRGAAARPAWESVNSQALLLAARAGLGVAALPEASALAALRAGEVARTTVTGLALSCPNQVVYHKDKAQSEAFRAFVEILLAGECALWQGTMPSGM